MPYKTYGHEQFEGKLPDGKSFTFYCHSQGTRYGFRHVCTAYVLDLPPVKVSCAYYNRTWESFRYESAIRKAISKLPASIRQDLTAQLIDARIRKEKEETAAFLEKFEHAAKLASPGLKKAIIDGLPGGMIQTEEQAKTALAIMQMGNLIAGKE